ncbi:MAG: FHA domain-containing protein [Chloroflexota bacterium]
MLLLRQLRPRTSDQVWQVSDVATEIGRVGATITLPDQSVSRRHARIAPRGCGFVLDDLGSANGTFVNGRQITTEAAIADGDELEFGDVVLVAEVRPPPVAPTPVASATILDGSGPARTSLPLRIDPAIELTISEESGGAPKPRAISPSPRPSHVAQEEVRPSARVQPIVVEAAARSSAPSHPARGLIDLIQAAGDITAGLRDVEPSLQGALQSFENCGGRAAVQAVIAQVERFEANPRDAAELQALTAWLPTVRRLLEAELALATVLAARGSNAHD